MASKVFKKQKVNTRLRQKYLKKNKKKLILDGAKSIKKQKKFLDTS